jgi:hypothetical protein
MRFVLICALATVLIGCGDDEKASSSGRHTANELNPERKNYKLSEDPNLKPDYSVLGVVPYPGAKPVDKLNNMTRIQTDAGSTYSASWFTADPPAKVVKFYETEVKVDSKTGENILGKTRDGHDFTMIATREKDGKTTRISIIVMR